MQTPANTPDAEAIRATVREDNGPIELSGGTGGSAAPGGCGSAPAASGANQTKLRAPASLAVYDPPLCCATGVCGPDVDPKLVQFAADLGWLAQQGVRVERFNLAQSPLAFAENDLVRAALTEKGEAALPLIIVEGKVAASGEYPSREALAALAGLRREPAGLFTPAVAELVAIGAAIAANCEPCLRHHTLEAARLGVAAADMARAVELATRIKEAPHRHILQSAARLIDQSPEVDAAAPRIP